MDDGLHPQHDGPDKAMIRRAVPPVLAGFVTDIVHYREHVAGSGRQVEAASLTVPLVIVLGERFRIGLGREPAADEAYGSFTSGLYAGPVVIRSAGAMECVQVNLTPPGARRFFGLPMREITERMVEIDAFGAARLAEVRDRLGAMSTPVARLDWIAGFVARRISASEARDDIAEAAYGMMLARRGDVRIADLAARLDVSRKHLAERFRDTIGLAPKAVARIARFNAAQALAARGDDWPDIAYQCGYADQAHLARDFRDLSGSTPTEWRRAA